MGVFRIYLIVKWQKELSSSAKRKKANFIYKSGEKLKKTLKDAFFII